MKMTAVLNDITKLRVDAIVDENGDDLGLRAGAYTLADALANGWTWLEDASATLNGAGTAVETPGAGVLVLLRRPFVLIVK